MTAPLTDSTGSRPPRRLRPGAPRNSRHIRRTSGLQGTCVHPFRRFLSRTLTHASASEQRADRELEHAHALGRPGIEVDAVGCSQGAEWRNPPRFKPDRAPQLVQLHRLVVIEPVSIIEKEYAAQLGFR